MKCLLLLFICFFGAVFSVAGQESMLEKLEKEAAPVENRVTDTFKGTRLINGHSVEMRETGVLDFLISHRFGRINSGAYSFFGLDESNIRLGLDYAFSDRLTLGLGRNSFLKVYDGFFKYKLFWQKSGEKNMPFSLVYFTNITVNTLKRPELPMRFSRLLGFNHQVMVSRKFSHSLSLQISPTLIHRNMVPTRQESNDLYAMSIGGRYKITPRTSLNVEYFYRWGELQKDSHHPLAIGFDLETGGHVFQLHLTNAQSMTETGFVPSTTGDFFGGDIHFGFNISRNFQLKENGEDW
jgi:hypothetical protein